MNVTADDVVTIENRAGGGWAGAWAVAEFINARLSGLIALHRCVPVCVAWEDCLRGEHEDDETQDGDQICRTCEPMFYVCDHCWDEFGDRGEWPCESAILLAAANPTPPAADRETRES